MSQNLNLNTISLNTTRIDRSNLIPLSLMLRQLIHRSEVIAIDTEFTGLGKKPNKLSKDIGQRYKELREVVLKHSVVSLGITLFTKANTLKNTNGNRSNDNEPIKKVKLEETEEIDPNSNEYTYKVSNFELLLSCQKDYVVSPASLAFLVKNGFDLNELVKNGIPYLPGNEGLNKKTQQALGIQQSFSLNAVSNLKVKDELIKYNQVLRDLMMELWSSKGSKVVHNGLLDLMYIYHSFYADLPTTLDTFLADVSDWTKDCTGIYDTKLLAEYRTREPASYLSFLFNKAFREQAVSKQLQNKGLDLDLHHFQITVQPRIQIPPILKPSEENITKQQDSNFADAPFLKKVFNSAYQHNKLQEDFCLPYMYHGYCSNKQPHQPNKVNKMDATVCTKCHDLPTFLDVSLVLAYKGFSALEKRKANLPAQLVPSPFLLDYMYKEQPYDVYKQVLELASTIFVDTDKPQMRFDQNSYHSACYDSFMTGYTFVHMLHYPDPITRLDLTVEVGNQAAGQPVKANSTLAALQQMSAIMSGDSNNTRYRNQIYLMGKDVPLVIAKSTFSKYSEAHKILWQLK